MKRVFYTLATAVATTASMALVFVGFTPGASAYQMAQNAVVSAKPASFTPNVMDGRVNALAQVGQEIVVGGTFTQVQAAGSSTTLTRDYIFAFDMDTGAISTTFVPQLDGDVDGLAAGPNGTVYVGGKFNHANGVAAVKVTQLNVSDGSKVSAFKPPRVSAVVQDVKYSQGRLYIGGEFQNVGGVSRPLLAELDGTTGALSSDLDLPVTGKHWGGTSQIWHMDVSPDGTKLLIIGNFTQVAGLDRVEIAMINIGTTPAAVANWETDLMKLRCYNSFAYVTRGIQFSPDGSYFVLGNVGGYGSGSPSLCDSISRWETNATGTALTPTWVDYTGGDSTYTVTPTGSAIYYGGHERWINNPSRADAAGPGAIPRPGIGALDPTNGLPLNWNPTRARGQGVFDMLATTSGLFVGSDTDTIGHQTHRKLAFFPLAGGHTVPQPTAPNLPVNVYSLGATSGQTNVLYRVDAGGPEVDAIDGGPNWAEDTSSDPSPYHNSGSNTADYSPIQQVDSSVPNTTPWAIFDHERWSPNDSPPMTWTFPVTAGTDVEVRLYFANRYSGTSQPGQRVFNVSLDGQTVLDHYDIVKDVGDQTGVMKAFDVTTPASGQITLTFTHDVENPLINGIEIINEDVPPPPTGQTSSRYYDGSSFGSSSPVNSGPSSWTGLRGAVDLNGTLYTAWSNGTFQEQSFDGTTFGAASSVDLYGLTQFSSDMNAMTGMFYDNGRLYFTKQGQSELYMRYFSTDLPVIGAGLKDLQAFQVSGNVDGVDWSQVDGMFLADGELYWVDAQDGTLHRIDWTNGAPVSGTGVVVSGPGMDGIDWRSQGIFAMQTTPPQPPVAKITTPVDCNDLSCSFDGSGSTDQDAAITSYAWDFGDNSTGSGVSPSHTYADPGTYTVQLTVTDANDLTGSTSVQVTVANTGVISYVDNASDSNGGSSKVHTLTVPGDVQPGDLMLLEFSDNSGTASITPPSSWTAQASQSSSGATLAVYSRVATASDPGSTVTLQTGSVVRGDLSMTAYRGTDQSDPVDQVVLAAETTRTASHTTPSAVTSEPGSLGVSIWVDKTADTTTWTPPAGQLTRFLFAGSGAGHMSELISDSGVQVPAGTQVGQLTATADSSSLQALMGVVVLNAAGD